MTDDKRLAALRMMVELWDANYPDDPCACVGASEDCRYPPPCELCNAREVLQNARCLLAAPPQQAEDIICLHPISESCSRCAPPQDKGEAAVSRTYFCSCGGACSAEEYIDHYFTKGHDRGESSQDNTLDKLRRLLWKYAAQAHSYSGYHRGGLAMFEGCELDACVQARAAAAPVSTTEEMNDDH